MLHHCAAAAFLFSLLYALGPTRLALALCVLFLPRCLRGSLRCMNRGSRQPSPPSQKRVLRPAGRGRVRSLVYYYQLGAAAVSLFGEHETCSRQWYTLPSVLHKRTAPMPCKAGSGWGQDSISQPDNTHVNDHLAALQPVTAEPSTDRCCTRSLPSEYALHDTQQ